MPPSGRPWLLRLLVAVLMVLLAAAPAAHAKQASVFDPPAASAESGSDPDADTGAGAGSKAETVTQACQDELNKASCSFDELVASCSGADSPRPSTLCINWARSLKQQPRSWATGRVPAKGDAHSPPKRTPSTPRKARQGADASGGANPGTGSGGKGADRRNAHP